MNESVCREKFILPSVEHTLGMLAGATVFSKLDANMGFWQVPLTKESAKYTTFITPFGHYYFNRLPFGIASAPEHFQRMMTTEVTGGLEGVLCHMDDILVWGQTQDEHDMRLHAVLEKTKGRHYAQHGQMWAHTPYSQIPGSCDFSRWSEARSGEDESCARDGRTKNVSELRVFWAWSISWAASCLTWLKRQSAKRPAVQEEPLVLGDRAAAAFDQLKQSCHPHQCSHYTTQTVH